MRKVIASVRSCAPSSETEMTHDIDVPLPPKQDSLWHPAEDTNRCDPPELSPKPPHDPIRDWQDCEKCVAALRLTWIAMADESGAPRYGADLLEWIRTTADRKLAAVIQSNAHLAPMGPLALVDWIRATARTKFDAMVRVGS